MPDWPFFMEISNFSLLDSISKKFLPTTTHLYQLNILRSFHPVI
jgi:hypothetical protein